MAPEPAAMVGRGGEKIWDRKLVGGRDGSRQWGGDARAGAVASENSKSTSFFHIDYLVCEEILPPAYAGPAEAPPWLAPEEAERLLAVHPDRNLGQTAIDQQLDLLLSALPRLQHALEPWPPSAPPPNSPPTGASARPRGPKPGTEWPRLIGERGEKPPQYPEPDYTIQSP